MCIPPARVGATTSQTLVRTIGNPLHDPSSLHETDSAPGHVAIMIKRVSCGEASVLGARPCRYVQTLLPVENDRT